MTYNFGANASYNSASVSITGGTIAGATINNAIIGGTTPAAVSATTLIATGFSKFSSWAISWEGGSVIANGTYHYTLSAPYAGTITAADYVLPSGTSFVFAVQIAGVSVTSLSAVTVNSSTAASTSSTGANTFTAGQVITLVVSSATGSPTSGFVSLRITKS